MFFKNVVPQPVGELEGLVTGGAIVRMGLPLVLCGLVDSEEVVLWEGEATLVAFVPHGVVVVALEVLRQVVLVGERLGAHGTLAVELGFVSCLKRVVFWTCIGSRIFQNLGLFCHKFSTFHFLSNILSKRNNSATKKLCANFTSKCNKKDKNASQS